MHHEHAGMNEAAARLYLRISTQLKLQGGDLNIPTEFLRKAMACIAKEVESRAQSNLQFRFPDPRTKKSTSSCFAFVSVGIVLVY